MRLCLVEDQAASELEPISLSRPVFDLLLGASSIGQKAIRAFGWDSGPSSLGMVARTHLVDVLRQRNPHVAINDHDWLARGPVIVANGRWVPPAQLEIPSGSESWLGLCEGQPACALVGPKQAAPFRAQ